MHRKFGPQGLVAVSVSLDEVEDQEGEAEVLEFLREHKATFTNFLLDEPFEVWEEKLGIVGVPAVFIFNRAGEIEKKYLETPDPDELDRLVEQLLRQK